MLKNIVKSLQNSEVVLLISPVELITYLFLNRDKYQTDESLIDDLKERLKAIR